MPPPPKVLLLDDSATTRSIVKVFLSWLEVEFVDASSAEEALSMLRAQPMSLLIADVNMPKMDGIELLQLIRASEVASVRELPVLLLTGDKSDATRMAALAANAGLVNKPVTGAELREAVLKLLPDLAPKPGRARG